MIKVNSVCYLCTDQEVLCHPAMINTVKDEEEKITVVSYSTSFPIIQTYIRFPDIYFIGEKQVLVICTRSGKKRILKFKTEGEEWFPGLLNFIPQRVSSSTSIVSNMKGEHAMFHCPAPMKVWNFSFNTVWHMLHDETLYTKTFFYLESETFWRGTVITGTINEDVVFEFPFPCKNFLVVGDRFLVQTEVMNQMYYFWWNGRRNVSFIACTKFQGEPIAYHNKSLYCLDKTLLAKFKLPGYREDEDELYFLNETHVKIGGSFVNNPVNVDIDRKICLQ